MPQTLETATPFDYSQPGLDLNEGDEFYEIRTYRDGKEIEQDLNEWEAESSLEMAIDGARYVLKNDGGVLYDYILVTVHGKEYPDGSKVPDGSIVWDSRQQF